MPIWDYATTPTWAHTHIGLCQNARLRPYTTLPIWASTTTPIWVHATGPKCANINVHMSSFHHAHMGLLISPCPCRSKSPCPYRSMPPCPYRSLQAFSFETGHFWPV